MRNGVLLAGLFVLGLLGPGAAAQPSERLNVLFIMSDDLRPELASYGHPIVKTPNIDALGAAGVRFERAFCQFPVCNPSRTSLLTGRYPTTTGVVDNERHFRDRHPDFVTLPQHFKQQGYRTLRTGKIFHGGLDDPLAWTEGGEAQRPSPTSAPLQRTKQETLTRQQRSDRIVVLKEPDGQDHADYHTAEQAIAYLNENKDKPFFLACGFLKPHSPPTAPKRFFDMYDVNQVRLPVDFAPRMTVPPGFPASSLTPNGDLFINRDASPEEAKEMIRAYWASLTWVDWNVGRVVDELDRLGLRDKTVIVFWGDHGYHLGEMGKWAKHGSMFDWGTHVPQIVVAPGRAGNGTPCNRIVESIDLYPTLVELCGLPMPDGLEGDSLVPLLDDPGAAWDRPAYSVGPRGDAVRTDRWRYARFADGEFLIDEDKDALERTNLASDIEFQAIKQEMSDLLDQMPNARKK